MMLLNILIAVVVVYVALFSALAMYSFCSGVHCVAVAVIAGRFAKDLGYGPLRRAYIVLNGLFHDIGKVMIPDAILHKEGKLTPTEREIIESHAKNWIARFVGIVFPAAIHHHLDANNNGYGVGKQSKMGAIIEICDVYEAVCGYFRTYAKPRTEEEVMDIMNKCAGKFDAELFKTFMENVTNYKHPAFIVKANDMWVAVKQ